MVAFQTHYYPFVDEFEMMKTFLFFYIILFSCLSRPCFVYGFGERNPIQVLSKKNSTSALSQKNSLRMLSGLRTTRHSTRNSFDVDTCYQGHGLLTMVGAVPTFLSGTILLIGNLVAFGMVDKNNLLYWSATSLVLGILGATITTMIFAVEGGFICMNGNPAFVMIGLFSILYNLTVIGVGIYGVYRYSKKKKRKITFSPWIVPTSNGDLNFGLSIQGRF